MSYEALGPRYAEIGECLLNYALDHEAPILLYAEAQPGVMGEGVYQDRPDDFLYIDCGPDLGDLLFAAWKAEKPQERWSAMELLIRNGRFTASFQYSDFEDIDPDREQLALRRHFGDKPITYPGPSFEERYEALNPANFPSDK